MHASSFYGRPMLEAESEQRRDEGPREEQPERKREREREETHALSKCATLCESWYARALVLPPSLLRFVRFANVTQATRFSPFFHRTLRLLHRRRSLSTACPECCPTIVKWTISSGVVLLFGRNLLLWCIRQPCLLLVRWLA